MTAMSDELVEQLAEWLRETDPEGCDEGWSYVPQARAMLPFIEAHTSAAIEAERERCAKVAADHYRHHPSTTVRAVNYKHAGRSIATAISEAPRG